MKILIVKTSALGDVVHTFPVISFLRNKFPEAQIDWVVEKESSELVTAHPNVTNTLTVDTKMWRRGKNISQFFLFKKQFQSKEYDVVFDLQGNTKSALLTFLAKSKAKVGFGKDTVPEWPNLWVTNFKYNPPVHQNIRDDYLHIVKSYFDDQTPFAEKSILLNISEKQINLIDEIVQDPLLKANKILVCPGSTWRNKQLNNEILIQFLHQLQQEQSCSFLFCWGTQKEKILTDTLYSHFSDSSIIIDRLPLPVLQNLMDRVSLVLAMDSLPLHLAGTTSTPTLSVFGPSSSEKYKPKGEQHLALQGTCPYGRTFEKRCPILRTCQTGACIQSLNKGDLEHAYEKIQPQRSARTPR